MLLFFLSLPNHYQQQSLIFIWGAWLENSISEKGFLNREASQKSYHFLFQFELGSSIKAP